MRVSFPLNAMGLLRKLFNFSTLLESIIATKAADPPKRDASLSSSFEESGSVKAVTPVIENLEERLLAIDWYQFEKLITELFKNEGYEVRHLGGAHPDGGIDLIVELPVATTLIQCKHWKAWKVGVRHIRELIGSMSISGTHAAILITLKGYTAEAKEMAIKGNVVLWDINDVIQRIKKVKPELQCEVLKCLNSDDKHCPKCESPMVLRTAEIGANVGAKFWGCSKYPKCRYTLKA